MLPCRHDPISRMIRFHPQRRGGGTLSEPSESLPPLIEHEEAVRQILALHDANGGATFSLYHGNLAGRPRFAVAVYPRRAVKVAGRGIPPARLRAFIRANQSLLEVPRNAVGTWFSEDEGATTLDVSSTVSSREDAVELARIYDQRAIFDLQRMESIDL